MFLCQVNGAGGSFASDEATVRSGYLGVAYFGVRAQVPPVGEVPCAPLLCGRSLGFLEGFWCTLLQPSGTCLAP